MALASLIPGQSEVRRVGVAAAIRNCCLDDLSCTRLLATPCAAPSGNNSFDVCCSTSSTHSYAEGGLEAVRSLIRIVSDTTKSRELSDAVRQCCAEAIAALARQAVGRDALVACDAPQLIRVGYASWATSPSRSYPPSGTASLARPSRTRSEPHVTLKTSTRARQRKSFLWSPTLLAISTSPRLRALVRLTWVP